MKELSINLFFLLSLGIFLNGCGEAGPFVVEIEMKEPVDTPFVVVLWHKKGTLGERMLTDYRETKIVYANQPTEFPAGRMGLDPYMYSNVRHPHFIMVKGGAQSLLPSDVQGETRNLIQGFTDRFFAPDKIYFNYEVIPLDAYIKRTESMMRSEGRSEEAIKKGIRNLLGNTFSGIGNYVAEVKEVQPDYRFGQFKPYLLKLVESLDVTEEQKMDLLRIINAQLSE